MRAWTLCCDSRLVLLSAREEGMSCACAMLREAASKAEQRLRSELRRVATQAAVADREATSLKLQSACTRLGHLATVAGSLGALLLVVKTRRAQDAAVTFGCARQARGKFGRRGRLSST